MHEYTTKTQVYRDGVVIAVSILLGITKDEASERLADHNDLIDAWNASGVDFTDTAALIAAELK